MAVYPYIYPPLTCCCLAVTSSASCPSTDKPTNKTIYKNFDHNGLVASSTLNIVASFFFNVKKST